MNTRNASFFCSFLLAALPFCAAQAAPAQAAAQSQAQPQAQQPKISNQQRDALIKLQTDAQAQKWSDVLTDANTVVENFPDSPYKSKVLYIALQAAGNLNSYDQLAVWADRVIQNDPNDIFARVQLADAQVDHTRDNDLDKDQSLKKVEDNANKALSLLQSTTTPPSNLPIDASQWPSVKQDLMARANYALGGAAELKKNYPDAQKYFGICVQTDPANNIYLARLLRSYMLNKQYDDAIAAAQKAIDNPTSSAAVKDTAQKVKDQATAAKAGASAQKPATPAPAPTTPTPATPAPAPHP